MCEFLIKAQEPWNNDDPEAPDSRARLGDIVVVRPDGWPWGREECLPRFVVVKVPTLSVESGEVFVQRLEDASHQVMLKYRRYQLSTADVATAIAAGGVVTLPATFVNKLIDKAT